MKNNAFQNAVWNLASDNVSDTFVMRRETIEKVHTLVEGAVCRVRTVSRYGDAGILIQMFSDSTFGPEKFGRVSRGMICIILNPGDDNARLCEVFASSGARGWVYKHDLEPVEG